MEMTRSGVTLCSWNSPASSAGNTRFYLSRSGAGMCVHCTRRMTATPATCCSAPQHMGKHITTHLSHWSVETAVVCMSEGKRTSLWTSTKLKPTLFRANTLHNRLFSEPPTFYWGKHIVSRSFHRSYFKANKISKSEG